MSGFEIVLSPFLFLIEQLFRFSYSITDNYGFSIVLLSLFISILLLPIFILIEKAKKKDDAIKLKMKPLVDEIKRCYKGQERFYYLKTLNRQHGYSPLRALIPILSLFLQIPFFIAAYQFLLAFEPLTGISFLFIKDLSLPDSLFGVVNILPIFMTLVNLLTVWFYTRIGNTAERRQMIIVAGIFLVLLFNLPAGLVLYWTMNNVFSFLRLFITNPEVLKKRKNLLREPKNLMTELNLLLLTLYPKLKKIFLIILIATIISQLNWALNNEFSNIVLRLSGAIIGSFAVILLLFFFVSIHKVELSADLKNIRSYFILLWSTFRTTFFIFILIILGLQINWAIQHSFNDFGIRLIMTTAIASVATILLGSIVIILQRKDIKIKWNYLAIKGKYVLIYVLILVAFIASQINWAFMYNFQDFILWLSIGAVSIWLLTLLIAHFVNILKVDPQISFREYKSHLRNQSPLLKIFLGIVIIFVLVSQIYQAKIYGVNIIELRIVYILVIGFLFTCFIGILSAFFSLVLTLFKQLNVKPEVYYSLLFLSIYFYFASRFYYSEPSSSLAIIALFFLLSAQITGILYYIKIRKDISAWVSFSSRFLLFIIGALQVLSLLIHFIGNWGSELIPTTTWIGNRNTLHNLFSLGSIQILISSPFYLNQKAKGSFLGIKSNISIYLLSLFYIFGFVFFWNPLTIYSSYPANFEFPAIDILRNNFKLFAWSIVFSVVVYLLTPRKFKYLWVVIILVVVCTSFMHNTLFTIDVGTLQENKFVNQDKLSQPIIYYIFEGLGILCIIFGIIWLLINKHIKLILFTLIFLNVVLISQAFFDAIRTNSFLTKHYVSAETPNSISFSKDKQNIVFMVVDMFHGWYMDRIIAETPEIKEAFEGFVWYPNTLSVSSITCSSMGPILAGSNYTIDKLNKDKSRSFEEKITSITQDFQKKIKSKGYSFTSTSLVYSTIDENLFDTYLPKWHGSWDQWNSQLKIGVSKEIGYTMLWENAFFYCAPLFLKSLIYNNGNWTHGDVETNENTSHAQHYNFLRLLPYISNTKNNKSSFIFIHTYASHHPWDVIDSNGKMHSDVSPYENNKWTIETIVKWIEWMKNNGVYDNTKIVLLSDHGPHWNHFNNQIDMNIPLITSGNDEVDQKFIMGLFALLMVKDFGKNDKLQTDFRFMSNLDASAIVFNENDPTKKITPYKRTLPASLVSWERKIWLKNELSVRNQFEVRNNMFDLKNWREIK